MKLAHYGSGQLGIIEGENLYDVSYALEAIPVARWPFPRGDQLVAHLDQIMDLVRKEGHSGTPTRFTEADLHCPVANPTKIIGAPTNYKAHIDESRADPSINVGKLSLTIGEVGLFLKASTSLIGPDQAIELPFPDRRTDHEVELGVVIGRRCRNVSQGDALDYIAGYTIALDMTIRGKEDRSFRKSVDGYSVAGPWLVTSDEIPEPNRLTIELRVNGDVRQRSNTSHMIYDVPTLVAWASKWYTLYPGDIIMTGTPEGVGEVRPGDRIECTVERIGAMNVRVTSKTAAPVTAGST